MACFSIRASWIDPSLGLTIVVRSDCWSIACGIEGGNPRHQTMSSPRVSHFPANFIIPITIKTSKSWRSETIQLDTIEIGG